MSAPNSRLSESRRGGAARSSLYDFDTIVSYRSTFLELKPGDTIATGTPVGAGVRFHPLKWLKPGDTVKVEVGELGA